MDVKLTPLRLADQNYEPLSRTQNKERMIEAWKGKALHGKYPALLENQHIHKKASLSWLSSSNIFAETEGFIISIQDRVVATRYYRKHIMGITDGQGDKCRLCGVMGETIEHIISGCTSLAAKQYTDRHNNVAKLLHNEIVRKYDTTAPIIPYYLYEPPPVVENDLCKIYWDRDIITDKEITNNRPDLVLTDKKNNTTYIIDVAIPLADNIDKKNAEKIQKYLALAGEIGRIWKQDVVRILPIVIGATGEIPHKLFESLKELNIKPSIYLQMQKAVLLKTCGIVRGVLTNSSQSPY